MPVLYCFGCAWAAAEGKHLVLRDAHRLTCLVRVPAVPRRERRAHFRTAAESDSPQVLLCLASKIFTVRVISETAQPESAWTQQPGV